MAVLSAAACDPVGFDFQPAAFDHQIGGGIGIGTGSERGRELAGGVGRERLAEFDPVLNHRIDAIGIEDNREFISRRSCFLIFLVCLFVF